MKISNKHKLLAGVLVTLLFCAVFFRNGILSAVRAIGCGSTTTCTNKEIGTIDGLGNFSTTTSLIKGQPYWVRLTINGEDNLPSPSIGPTPTPVPKGVDTMMMVDLSSSMNKAYPKNTPDDGTTVLMYQAAQAALNKYIDTSDQANDYLGFGSFLWCGKYLSSTMPVWWTYDDFNRVNNKMVGFSAIHIPLIAINNNPNYFKGIINKIAFDSSDDPDFCGGTGVSHVPTSSGGMFNSTGEFNGGSSIGGPISAAASFLSPTLNDPKAKRSDGTSYRDSKLSNSLPTYNKNNGPYARQYTKGQAIPKYIILASDFGEGAPPLVDDIDFDKNARTIVQNAKFYGIKIYLAVTKKQSKLNADTQARINYIVNTTGGKAYYGESQTDLVNNFSAIRNDITVDSTGGALPTTTPVSKTDVTVTEKVTLNYFKIDSPTHNAPITFKVVQPGSPETDITNLMCPDANSDGTPDCISNKKFDGSGNLIGYDVRLDPLAYGQSRYVYFRVTPTKSTNGVTVNVDDDTTSKVDYEDIPHQVVLDNVAVTIADPSPFFQVYGGGDVYSASNDVAKSIKSFLPSNTDVFASQANSVVLHRGGSTYGNGAVSSNNREVDPYTLTYDQTQLSYRTLYNEYGGLIPASNIKPINGLTDFTSSGYYMDSTSSSNGKYTVTGSGWTGQNLSGKKIVMFIPGDLYINTNFTIQKDGNSLIVFIVKGRVGIDPSVTNVQGIYIADGIIDTGCASSSSFASNNKCSPDAGGAGLTNQLTLEGMFISNSVDAVSGLYSGSTGGFNLDRAPATAIPGEKFTFRPDFMMSSSLSVGRKNYTWIENLQ